MSKTIKTRSVTLSPTHPIDRRRIIGSRMEDILSTQDLQLHQRRSELDQLHFVPNSPD